MTVTRRIGCIEITLAELLDGDWIVYVRNLDLPHGRVGSWGNCINCSSVLPTKEEAMAVFEEECANYLRKNKMTISNTDLEDNEPTFFGMRVHSQPVPLAFFAGVIDAPSWVFRREDEEDPKP